MKEYSITCHSCCNLARCVSSVFSACDCDPVGSLASGVCDSHTDLDLGMIGGQCRCKQNVRGPRCDYCKEGHYGLSIDDPLGCQRKCVCELALPTLTTIYG